MCGITGFMDLSARRINSDELIPTVTRMADALLHAGVFGNLLLLRWPFLHIRLDPVPDRRICKKPFEAVNGNGLIELPPVALAFTRMKADTTADGWKGIFPEDRFPGLFEKPLCRQHLDPSDILSSRAGSATGRGFFIVPGTQKPPRSRFITLRGEISKGHK